MSAAPDTAVTRKADEHPSFVDVYDAHIHDVFGFCAYRLGSRSEAEDLTQLTFERALLAWSRFDPERARARTWLLAIARNLLVDHFRRDRCALALDDLGEEALNQAAGPEEALGPAPELAVALAALTQRDREVLALRYGGDLTGPEIAEMLGLSVANVQQVISRSLRKLRTRLETGERHASRRYEAGGGTSASESRRASSRRRKLPRKAAAGSGRPFASSSARRDSNSASWSESPGSRSWRREGSAIIGRTETNGG